MAKSESQDKAEAVVRKASKVERHRVRGRNMFDVVNQLVTKYNSSNGWSVVKVTPALLTFEVVLERSVTQGEAQESANVKSVSKEANPDEKEDAKTATEEGKDAVDEKSTTKQAPKTTKRSSATSAKKTSEAKKV